MLTPPQSYDELSEIINLVNTSLTSQQRGIDIATVEKNVQKARFMLIESDELDYI